MPRLGFALTATRANRTSGPAALTAAQVRSGLGDEIDAIVADRGRNRVGAEDRRPWSM